MARIECEIEETELETETGRTVDGIRATCGKCGHEVESFGTHENSVRRCLVLMREECPEEERNYYLGDL